MAASWPFKPVCLPAYRCLDPANLSQGDPFISLEFKIVHILHTSKWIFRVVWSSTGLTVGDGYTAASPKALFTLQISPGNMAPYITQCDSRRVSHPTTGITQWMP